MCELGPWYKTMTYPFGGKEDITAESLKLVREVGFTACFSDYGGGNLPPANTYDVLRIEMRGDQDTVAWKARAHGIDLGRRSRALQRPPSAGAEPEPR